MPDKVRASHILLMYAGSARSSATRSQDEAKKQIAEIKTQLDEGVDFSALAGKFSDCPSANQGGDLGAFGPGQMVKPFEDAAFALEIGGMSDVVESAFGYHVIMRTG